MIIKFTVPGKPFGKQRPRVAVRGSFARAYTPKETVNYENLVKICYQQESQGYAFPDDTPLRIDITAYHEIPKSTSKRKREQMIHGDILPTKKPDFDNISKVICDSLNNIAYRDDSSIVKAVVCKKYAALPRVEVIIQDLHEMSEDGKD